MLMPNGPEKFHCRRKPGSFGEGARPGHVVRHRVGDAGIVTQLRNRLLDGLAVGDLELNGPARESSHGLYPRPGREARPTRVCRPGLVADDHVSRGIRSRGRRLVGGRAGAAPASRMPPIALTSAPSRSLRERSVVLEHMRTPARLGRVRGGPGCPGAPGAKVRGPRTCAQQQPLRACGTANYCGNDSAAEKEPHGSARKSAVSPSQPAAGGPRTRAGQSGSLAGGFSSGARSVPAGRAEPESGAALRSHF